MGILVGILLDKLLVSSPGIGVCYNKRTLNIRKVLCFFKLLLGASIPYLWVGRSVFKTILAIDLLALSSKQKMAMNLSGLSSKHN